MRDYPLATVACFDPTRGDLPRRKLDPDRLRSFLRRLSDGGAESLLIGASTGQGHLRTVAELEAFFVAAADARQRGVRMMALLRPEDGVSANASLLHLLKDLGYDVVFIRPGTDLPDKATDDQVVENVAPLVRLAHEVGLPVGLYSISDVSGAPLTARAAASLTRRTGGDGIVAIKVTEADYDTSTREFLNHPALSHLTVVQGWDPHLARALQEGRSLARSDRAGCGVTSGAMSFALFQYLHLFAAAARQEWDEVRAAQASVTAVFESMQDRPDVFADLQRAKYIMGLGHPLTGTVSGEQVERVMDALRALPRAEDRHRLCRSLDLMGDGPMHETLRAIGSQ